MNRRQFLRWGGGAVVVALAGFAVFRGRRGAPADDDWAGPLFDDRFAAYARERAGDERKLRVALEKKGVLKRETGVDAARVRELARSDALVAYGDFTYTKTELQLYALAWLRQRHRAMPAPGVPE
ncbi:MAG: hypothetical protein ACE5FL_03295 [Myxococcota bacterium]